MTAAYVLDTETTGIKEPHVVELALKGPLPSPTDDGETTLLNFRVTKPIEFGAMATHHIIEADLTGFDLWPGAWPLPADAAYVIGHNIDFDWQAIGSPNVKRICTLALARSVWPSLDSHKLAALIYYLYPHGMARDLVKNAHNAAADVGLCWRVLQTLWDVVGRPQTWEKLWEISEKARIPTIFTFGKWKDRPIAEIRRIDPSYISWCLSGKCDLVNDDPYLRKALTA